MVLRRCDGFCLVCLLGEGLGCLCVNSPGSLRDDGVDGDAMLKLYTQPPGEQPSM